MNGQGLMYPNNLREVYAETCANHFPKNLDVYSQMSLCLNKMQFKVSKRRMNVEGTANINFITFNPTSLFHHSGLRNGACVLLEQNMDKQMLWLACRHHIMEISVSSSC